MASATTLPPTSAPVLATAVTKLCQQVSLAKPAKVKTYYEGVLTKFDGSNKAEKNFPNTLAYIKNSDNEKEFLAGGPDCVQYFVGLKAALLTDYKATGLSLEAARNRVAERVTNFIAKIQAAIQALKN